MSDIVERLRRDLMDISFDDIEAMAREAADAIERLRITVNDQAATITRMFEEIVQLQDRLRRATTS